MIANHNELFLSQFEDFLNQIALSPKTIANYLADLRVFTRWAEETQSPRFQLTAVTPAQIRAYRDHLQHERHRAPATINRHLQALRKCCAYIAQTNLSPLNAAEEIALVNAPNTAPDKAMTEPEIKALLSAATAARSSIARRDAAILHLLVKTGLRVAEVADLQMDDVVFDYPGVHLTIRDSRGKGTRDIPLPEEVCHALKEWLVIRPKTGVIPQVFLSQEGKPVSARTIQRIVERCARSAGLNDVTAQLLRRTYALQLLAQTDDLALVSQRLGHQDTAITLQYLDLK